MSSLIDRPTQDVCVCIQCGGNFTKPTGQRQSQLVQAETLQTPLSHQLSPLGLQEQNQLT